MSEVCITIVLLIFVSGCCGIIGKAHKWCVKPKNADKHTIKVKPQLSSYVRVRSYYPGRLRKRFISPHAVLRSRVLPGFPLWRCWREWLWFGALKPKQSKESLRQPWEPLPEGPRCQLLHLWKVRLKIHVLYRAARLISLLVFKVSLITSNVPLTAHLGFAAVLVV